MKFLLFLLLLAYVSSYGYIPLCNSNRNEQYCLDAICCYWNLDDKTCDSYCPEGKTCVMNENVCTIMGSYLLFILMIGAIFFLIFGIIGLYQCYKYMLRNRY